MLAEPAHRIEHDAQRARPGDVARRQLRIVRGDRAGADDDRVAQRAHPVQVQDVFLAGDELRIAGVRGDEAVQALAEVADRDRAGRRGAADRQIQVDQRRALVVRRQEQLPAGLRAPGERRVGSSDRSGRTSASPLRLRSANLSMAMSRVRSESDSSSAWRAAANRCPGASVAICSAWNRIGVSSR